MVLILFVALMGQAAPTAPTPSFDCGRASTPVERAVCSDNGLARLDATMASSYRAALSRLQPAACGALVRDQRRYLTAQAEWFENRERWLHFPDLVERMAARTALLDALASGREAWEGRWASLSGEVQLRTGPTGEVEAELATAQPTNARWVCQVRIEGRPDGSHLQALPTGETGWAVDLEKAEGVLVVSESPLSGSSGSPGYCGSNGSVTGTYFPVSARSPLRQGRPSEPATGER